MIRRVTILLFVFLCAALSLAQDVRYEKYKLPNGLTVILHEDHTLPIVTVNTWYRVGAKDEPPRRSGFAHLFEHLMFMGTERVPGGEFDKIMEAGGGSNNASTSNDWTNYYDVGPSNLLPTLLWLEADRLEELGRTMDQKKLDLQRDVVRNERRESENAPYGKADMKLPELMFPQGHPYHYSVIGLHEDLEAATVKDVQEFFATYYVPNNASLVVAGDFDPKAVRPMLDRLFGTLPRANDPVHRDAPQPRLERVVRHQMVDQVQFPRITMAWHSPPAYKPGDAEMDLAAAVLTSGISSRLYQRLVYKEPLATDVSAYQQSLLLGSMFVVNATAKQGVPLERIERAIDEELARFAKEGPTDEELRRQVAQIEYRMLSSLQSVQTKADLLNAYEFYYGEPNSFQRDLDRYRKASRDSVRRVARVVLKPDERVILTVIPQGERPQENPRNERPKAAEAASWSPPLPVELTLSNGLRVQYWHRPDVPLMALTTYLPIGSAADPAGKEGVSSLTADMLDEGAGSLGATEFEQALDRLGANFGASVSQTSTTVGLTSTATNFSKAMSLYADALLRPRFEAKEWDRVKRQHLEGLQQALDDPGTVARRLSLMAFFGPAHPYGRPVSGTVRSAGTISLDDVRRQYQQILSAGGATIFAAGSMAPEALKSELERALAAWKPAATAPSTPQPAPAPAMGSGGSGVSKVLLVDKPGAVQTVIRFIMPAPTASDPNRIELQALGTVLGGTFTSRLNANLREAKGYTYGAGSGYVLEPTTGYMTAASDVRTDVTGAALREFLKEFESIRSGNVTDEEAGKAKNSMRTGVVQSATSLQGLVSTAIAYHRMGKPYAALGEDLREMAGLTPAQLNALAKQAVPVEQGLLVLVGDRAQILKQLEGLGLPEPQVVQAE